MQAIHNWPAVSRQGSCCFKEQRYKINASNSQLNSIITANLEGCFKEQRYKINASNSQQSAQAPSVSSGCFKEQTYRRTGGLTKIVFIQMDIDVGARYLEHDYLRLSAIGSIFRNGMDRS